MQEPAPDILESIDSYALMQELAPDIFVYFDCIHLIYTVKKVIDPIIGNKDGPTIHCCGVSDNNCLARIMPKGDSTI